MIHFSTPKHHWNYFLAIQQDLEKVSRYVEFCKDNLNTYSIELAHILLSASSEVDVVLKQLCKIADPEGEYGSITHYKNTIVAHIPDMVNESISIPRYGLIHRPWENWNGENNPDWWRSYNKVKHQRNDHYSEANLQNVLNSVGALLITTVYYYKFAFSVEAGHNVDFRDTTRQLSANDNAFLLLNPSYYYAAIIG